MPSWREAFGRGTGTRRNTLLILASLFLLFTLLTRDTRNLFFVAFALLLSHLFSARLEWEWVYPSRVRRGQAFVVAIRMRNKAFLFSFLKGDAIGDIRFTVTAHPPITVVGKATREISVLEAGGSASLRFEIHCPPDAPPDLYGFEMESTSSAGSRRQSFEVYVYDEA